MRSWTVTFCVVGLSAMIFTSGADPVKVSSPPDHSSPPPVPAAVREGAVMFPHDRMKQGDVVALKELMKKSISNLQELVEEEDTHINVRISKGLDRLNERLEEGDDHMKEELDEDIARMKERMTKGLNYVKELLTEGDVKTDEELTKLKEAFEKRQQDDVKQSVSAMMDDLRQQMAEFQAEQKSTKDQLQATQTELKTHQETLQTTRVDLNTTRQSLQSTRQQLHEEQQTSTALKAQLEQEIRSLKMEMDSVQSSADLMSSEMGSTFTRWGRKTCPDNTSLVYSGYVGGQYYNHAGGGSNYLCLVRDPQLDNMTIPAYYNNLYGAQYNTIEGQHNQDAVCSVCRAPQVTTLMIPATLSCPPGWTTQYRGHLVSGRYIHKGRNEFVCLDEVREHREGGHANADAALFYHVVTECGSLPCLPYVQGKVVTCAVCSK